MLVALVIFDRLYVANAGDSRAILFLPKEEDPVEMSFDFTPGLYPRLIPFAFLVKKNILGLVLSQPM